MISEFLSLSKNCNNKVFDFFPDNEKFGTRRQNKIFRQKFMFIHASAVGPVEDGGGSEWVEFGSDHRPPDHLPNRILRPVDPREYFQ